MMLGYLLIPSKTIDYTCWVYTNHVYNCTNVVLSSQNGCTYNPSLGLKYPGCDEYG